MKKEIKLQEKDTYISPNIEIVEIQTEQNILASGSADGDVDSVDLAPTRW